MFPLTGAEFGSSVDEPEEFLVDDPNEVPWLVELLNDACVSAPSVMRSSGWAGLSRREMPHNIRLYDCHLIIECACAFLAVTIEMKQVSKLSNLTLLDISMNLKVCLLFDMCAGFQEQS